MPPKPDPKNFPDPPLWATYCYQRQTEFKMHNGIGPAKNAVSALSRSAGLGGKTRYDIWVYQWDEDSCVWQESFFFPRDSNPREVPGFYGTKSPKGQRAPSQKAVDAAIASIVGGD